MSIDFQNLFICFQCGLRLSGLTFVFVTEEKLTNTKKGNNVHVRLTYHDRQQFSIGQVGRNMVGFGLQ